MLRLSGTVTLSTSNRSKSSVTAIPPHTPCSVSTAKHI